MKNLTLVPSRKGEGGQATIVDQLLHAHYHQNYVEQYFTNDLEGPKLGDVMKYRSFSFRRSPKA